jgi:hypothetical protein
MKQVKFRGKVNGKIVRGSWFCAERPNRAQTIAERLVGDKIINFMFVVKDIKDHMIKCEVNE